MIIPTSSRCRSNGKPPGILKARDGVISSHVTRETGCGAMGSPWEIRAPRDAVIRLHVLDFFWFFNNGPICGNRYLEIADVDAESARSPTQLCSQTERRSEPIIFDTSAIRIWISPPAQGEFLLYYSGHLTHARTHIYIYTRRRGSRGGPRVPWPPPPFSGEKTRGPKTTHTEEKKIKIGQPRSKIQLG